MPEYYESPIDGCDYNNPADEFWFALLGFCGCGINDHLMHKMFDYLCYCEWWRDNLDINDMAVIREKMRSIGDEEFVSLLAYIADSKELTQHGTSINGAWLTDSGKEWLRRLKEHYAKEDKS